MIGDVVWRCSAARNEWCCCCISPLPLCLNPLHRVACTHPCHIAAPPSFRQFRNEELYRLQEVAPGTSYRVLTTVLTTAMHGEKFRCGWDTRHQEGALRFQLLQRVRRAS